MENNENHGYLAPASESAPVPRDEHAQQAITGRKVIQPIDPGPATAQNPSDPAPAPAVQQPVSSEPSPVQTQAASESPAEVVSGSFAYTQAAPVPTAPAAPVQTYLTGSQLAEESQPIPKGVYALVAWNVIGLIASFLDSSQSGTLFTIGLLVSLLVTVGLLFRLEAMRKAYIALSILVALLGVFEILGISALQARYHKAQKDFEASVAKLDAAGRLSGSQKQKFEDIDKTLSAKSKQTDKALGYTYVIVSANTAANVAAAVYLTRPGVKEVFRNLEQ